MNRRIKERLDIQLVCRIGCSNMLSTPRSSDDVLMSENFSRAGLLLRWLPTIPLPSIGCKLTVDVELPALPGAEPRAMRCSAQVVRIDTAEDSQQLVGMTIGKIRFVAATPVAASCMDLESMPAVNSFLN
jgi:hypothetical protein